MPTLNSRGTLPSDIRSTFRGSPEATTFRPGERFCRFVTRGENSLEGPWWVRQDEMSRLEAHARRLGLPIQEVARARMAVREAWSSRMDFLVTARLLCSAVGWVGKTRHQNLADTGPLRNVSYIGDGEQVYLPNLLCDNRFTTPESRTEHRGLPTPRAVVIDHKSL